MQNQPYNYYSPRSNDLQNSYRFQLPQGTPQFLPPLNPLGQQARQNHHFESNYNSRRTEDALDRFQKEQTAKPAFNQSQVSEPFQDPYQYSGSPAKQPVSNDSCVNSPQHSSPTKSKYKIKVSHFLKFSLAKAFHHQEMVLTPLILSSNLSKTILLSNVFIQRGSLLW